MNNTKLATKALRTHWAEIIHDRTNSGLTVCQYCHEHGLSRDAYFYWLKKVKAAALESAGIDFVELPAPDEKSNLSADFDTEAIVTVGKVNIRINCMTILDKVAKQHHSIFGLVALIGIQVGY